MIGKSSYFVTISIFLEISKAYQKIPLLWDFAVRFGGRHRARLCAGGHKTRDPEKDYYSGVVELETVRILFVIAALKKFKAIAADVASAYVQTLTSELVYAIAGQEFGPWQGKILTIVKALYGLKRQEQCGIRSSLIILETWDFDLAMQTLTYG